MNLTEYKRTDFNQKIYDKATIYISGKDGKFYLNKQAVRMIDLNQGDRVMCYQDNDEKDNWYIAKTDSEEGFKILGTSNSGGGLHFHSVGMARKIRDSIGRTGKNTSMIISPYPEEDKYFLLITHSARKVQKTNP